MRRKKIMQPDITTLRNPENLKAAETPEKYGANTPQKKIKKSVDTDCAQ
jgi:hypothetical protein